MPAILSIPKSLSPHDHRLAQALGQGDFPFYFVQLASYDANHGDSQHGSGWAELREAQTSP